MDKQEVINNLVRAYRKADADFDAANAGPAHLRPSALSHIIGCLQGSISLATIELGMREPIRLKAPLLSGNPEPETPMYQSGSAA
jgi:hypothetical protein